MSEAHAGLTPLTEEHDGQSAHRERRTVNWLLAVLTVPGALVVVAYQYLQVLATAGCSDHTCAKLGPSPFVFGLIEYGAPVVALVTVIASFATARKRRGIILPLVAWALLLTAAAVLTFSFDTP